MLNQNETQRATPLLEGHVSTLANNLDVTDKFVSMIQHKLHSIVDERQPQKGSTSEGSGLQSGEPDFNVKMNYQQSRLSYINESLREIYAHLERII